MFTDRRQREFDLTSAVHVHRNRHAGEPFPKRGRTEERLPVRFDGSNHAPASAIGVVAEVVAVNADNGAEASRGGRQPDSDLPRGWHRHAAFEALAGDVEKPALDAIALQHAGLETDQQVRRRNVVIRDAEKLGASPAPGVIKRLRHRRDGRQQSHCHEESAPEGHNSDRVYISFLAFPPPPIGPEGTRVVHESVDDPRESAQTLRALTLLA